MNDSSQNPIHSLWAIFPIHPFDDRVCGGIVGRGNGHPVVENYRGKRRKTVPLSSVVVVVQFGAIPLASFLLSLVLFL
jgi:hypothetical protein